MKKYIPILTILVILSSCTSEFDGLFPGVREKSGVKTIFHATTEATYTPETKTYADQSMRVVWNEGDQVTIFNKITYNHGFEFNGDDGDTAGDFVQFTPEPSGFSTWEDIEHYYAVYPYSTGNKCDYDGKLTVVLPSVQSYKEDSFGIGANTMVAVSDSTRLQFKNVGGYLSLRLYGDGVKVSSLKIEGNAGEKISGKAFVTIPMGGTPTTVMDETATESITIVCDPAVQLGADTEHYTDFWFVIPPVTFSEGFRITVTDDQGGVFEKTTTNSLTVTRNQLDWMNPLEVIPGAAAGNVEFADANFKAYCVNNFDTNGDGEISIAEAIVVTEINVSTENIESLEGIECFENLTTLSCRGVQNNNGDVISGLTSLDVSNNRSLTTLDCCFNHLTALDLSNQTALTSLIFEYNPDLASLDVSGCSSLGSLSSRSNDQLASLNVAGCTSLKSIYLETNELTSLDMHGFTELTSIYCYYLTELTSLDVTGCTALTSLICSMSNLTSLDVSDCVLLENLCIDGNPLSSIDLSNNTALTGLGCAWCRNLTSLDLSNNTSLENFSCGQTGLESLVFGNNTSLKEVVCEESALTSLDVSGCPAITKLSCRDNELTELDVSNNLALTDLDCTENPLTTLYLLAGQEIAELSKEDSTQIVYKGALPAAFPDENFRSFVFENFDTDIDGILSASELGSVDSFNCSSRSISSLSGIEYFANLRNLECNTNQLTSLDFSHNTALNDLSCYSNQITSLNLSNNTALTGLNCKSNQLTSLDLSHNTALTYLDCSENQLTSLDLSHNTTLHFLWCRQNQLTSLDVSNNAELTRLNCTINPMTTLYLKSGQEQTLTELQKPDTTVIEYK